MKKRFLCILLGAVVAVVVTETVLRVFYRDKLPERHSRPLIYQADTLVNYMYVPNTVFTVGSDTLFIDENGFIGKTETLKSKERFRIAFVGDSRVSGAIHLNHFISFCFYLQSLLDENGYDVDVVNCAIDGSDRDLDLFRWTEHRVTRIDPDLIFAQFDLPFSTLNLVRESYRGYMIVYIRDDYSLRREQCRAVDKLLRFEKTADILYRSYLVRAFGKWYLKHYHPTALGEYIHLYTTRFKWCRQDLKSELSPEESYRMIRQLNEQLAESGSRLYLFSVEENRELFAEAKENGLPFINLQLTFGPEEFIPDDGHLNELGAQRIATRFYEIITKYNLVPAPGEL